MIDKHGHKVILTEDQIVVDKHGHKHISHAAASNEEEEGLSWTSKLIGQLSGKFSIGISGKETEHTVERTIEHTVDHTKDHTVDTIIEHTVEHTVEHSVEHSSDHTVKHIVEHTVECSIEHTEEHRSDRSGSAGSLTHHHSHSQGQEGHHHSHSQGQEGHHHSHSQGQEGHSVESSIREINRTAVLALSAHEDSGCVGNHSRLIQPVFLSFFHYSLAFSLSHF